MLVREVPRPQVDDGHDEGPTIEHEVREWGRRNEQAPIDAQHPQEVGRLELEGGTLGLQGAAVLDDPRQADDEVEAETAQE